MKNVLLFLLIPLLISGCIFKNKKQYSGKITVQIELPKNFEQRDIRIFASPINFVMYPALKIKRPEIEGRYAKWEIGADTTMFLDLSSLLGPKYRNVFLEPGDDVTFDVDSPSIIVSGPAKMKVDILNDVVKAVRSLPLPSNPNRYEAKSRQDYLDYYNYVQQANHVADSVINNYRNKVSRPFICTIREYFYSDFEYRKLIKFDALAGTKQQLQLSNKDLNAIYDSTFNNTQVNWLINYTGNPFNYYVYYNLARKKVERKFNFDYNNDTLKSPLKRKIEYSKTIEELFDGDVEITCLTFLVTEQGIKDHGYKEKKIEFVDSMLLAYYAIPGHPLYKEFVKRYRSRYTNSYELNNNPQSKI